MSMMCGKLQCHGHHPASAELYWVIWCLCVRPMFDNEPAISQCFSTVS